MEYPAQLLTGLDSFEGRVSWPYLDDVDPANVTAGCGREITTLADFARLPWIIPASADIEAEWTAIRSCRSAMAPHFYENFTSIRLSDESIDAMKLEDLDRVSAVYDQRLPGWQGFPIGALSGLLDMGFNMGPGKLWEPPPHGFPHFLAAVAAGEWGTAAAKCERQGVQAARNAWTKQQFLSAAVIA